MLASLLSAQNPSATSRQAVQPAARVPRRVRSHSHHTRSLFPLDQILSPHSLRQDWIMTRYVTGVRQGTHDKFGGDINLVPKRMVSQRRRVGWLPYHSPLCLQPTLLAFDSCCFYCCLFLLCYQRRFWGHILSFLLARISFPHDLWGHNRHFTISV